jgi:hypothetical protein
MDMGVFNTESVGLGVEVVLAPAFFCDARGDMQIMLFLSSLAASPSKKKVDEDAGARAAVEGVYGVLPENPYIPRGVFVRD